MANATWKIELEDGRAFTIDADERVPQKDVVEAATPYFDSWENGGHYMLEFDLPEEKEEKGVVGEVVEAVTPGAGPKLDKTERNVTADKHEAALVAKRNALIEEIERLASVKGTTPGLLLGGTAGGLQRGLEEGEYDRIKLTPAERAGRIAQLRKTLEEVDRQLKIYDSEKNFGTAVGGIGGALAGATGGAAVGRMAPGPLKVPGALVGSTLGAILGAGGGAYYGKLADIEDMRRVRDITPAQAEALAKREAIQTIVFDGAFMLIFGPGGKLVGKLVAGDSLGKALRSTAKEVIDWNSYKAALRDQREAFVRDRTKNAPPELGQEVSRKLGVPPRAGAQEEVVEDLMNQTGKGTENIAGPTVGETTGRVGRVEGSLRRIAPEIIAENDKALGEAADSIRNRALNTLDQAGARTGQELDEAFEQVVSSADAGLKNYASPIFEEAARLGVKTTPQQTKPLMNQLRTLLIRNEKSVFLEPGEEAFLRARLEALERQGGVVDVGILQEMVSAMKRAMRGTHEIGAPSSEWQKVLGGVIKTADGVYDKLLKGTDRRLAGKIRAVRQLYREVNEVLYSETMSKIARRDPERVGAYIARTGNTKAIQEVRSALDKLSSEQTRLAQGAGRQGSGIMTAKAFDETKNAIDAGIIKGFLEEQTKNLDALPKRLTDPQFTRTLRELLLDPRAKGSHRLRNARVLADLDRVVAAIRLSNPESLPRPGRIFNEMGIPVGSIGLGTLTFMISGGLTGPALVAALVAYMGSGLLAKAMTRAMTTPHSGVLRKMAFAMRLGNKVAKQPQLATVLLQQLQEIEAEISRDGED